MPKTEWSVECKNDSAGVIFRFESVNLNGDGHFDREEFDSTSGPRTVYLPAETCNFVVEMHNVKGHVVVFSGQVSNGNLLVASGTWTNPKVEKYSGTGSEAQAATTQ
jgi:hypothetical protein